MILNYEIRRIENILKQKNYKITNGRKEIIKLFVKNRNNHYKPEKIYDLVKSYNISFPTVYRTIEILKKSGIIKETIIDRDRYYELQMFSKKSLHLHLKCMECGMVSDYIDTKSILYLLDQKDKIEKQHEMVLNNIYTTFYGICRDCRR